MTCNVFKSKPMTLREAKALGGYESASGYPSYVTDPKLGARNIAARKAEWDAAQERLLPHSEAPMFLCGDLKVDMCKGGNDCMYPGDKLCDWPMGKGKTCDLALCDDHARGIGEDRDLCPIHFGLWQKGGSR